MRQLWGDLLRLDVSRWFSHQLSYPLTVVWSRTFIGMKSDTRGAICDI